MEIKNEIKTKYVLFRKSKKLTIASGALTTISLFGYVSLRGLNIKLLSILLLSLTIISFIVFLIFWTAIRPMKRHILSLIKEYEK